MSERFWLNHADHPCQGCRESARDANPGANPAEAAPARPHSCVWNASRVCSSWPSVAKPQRAQRIVTGWASSASPVDQPRHRDSSLTGTARVPGRPDFAGELPRRLLTAEPVNPEGAVGCGRGRPLAFRVPAGFADRLQAAAAPPVLVPGREQERRVALAAPDRFLSDAGGDRSGSPSRSAPVAGRGSTRSKARQVRLCHPNG